MTARCLGKHAARDDHRTIRLATLLGDALPASRAAKDWSTSLPRDVGMMRNDAIGDCTCAGAGHLIQLWTSCAASEVTVSDDDVVAAYSAITGYTPSDPTTDRGAVLIDVLNYWRQVGVGKHQIGAYALVDKTNVEEVKVALELFGGLYTGAMLPSSAQADIGGTWSKVADGDAGSWGGHCLGPDTRVLTADLRWRAVGDVKVGDHLVGYDEYSPTPGKRKYQTSIVEEIYPIDLPCVELELSDGTRLYCSEDHVWLTRDSGGTSRWEPAGALKVAAGDRSGTQILKPLQTWREDTSRDAGYLAAAFDGEGWIDGETSRAIHKLGFAQKTNAMWEHVTAALKSRGFKYSVTNNNSGFERVDGTRADVNNLVMHGRQQLLEFLGAVRPHKLLAKFDPSRLGAMYSGNVEVVYKEPVGKRTVMAMRTSTRTFIAEGLASHNCMALYGYDPDGITYATWGRRQRATWEWFQAYADEVYAIISPDWVSGDKPAPNGLDIAKLQQYLAELK